LANASTSVASGTVSGHWTLAGSPYLIQGSIYIPQDSTLLIDPGVTVNFQTSFTPYLLVQGQLLAMGAIGDSIYFTAADTTHGFHGIRFMNAALNGVADTQTTLLQHKIWQRTRRYIYDSKWRRTIV